MDVLRRPPGTRAAHQVAALISIGALGAAAAQPALDFKGLPLPASEAALHAAFPGLQCTWATEQTRELGDTSCRPRAPSEIDPATTCGRRAWFPSDAAFDDCLRRAASLKTFAEIPLEDAPAFLLRDGTVNGVIVWIASEYHHRVVAAISQKYGGPSEVKDNVIQNLGGATFVNSTATWQLTDGVIRAQRYGRTLNRGTVTYFTRDEFARQNTLPDATKTAKDI